MWVSEDKISDKAAGKLLEEIMAEVFPYFIKKYYLHIQNAQ